MSYSRQTLAAFSAAIGDIHAAPAPAATPSPALPREATSDEDLAYLIALLESHRQLAAQPRPAASPAPAAQPLAPTPEFAKLRALGLTRRECEVVFWIAQGKGDAEIGAIAGCAPKTVSKHVEHILEKLGAETRQGAAHTAQEWLRQQA